MYIEENTGHNIDEVIHYMYRLRWPVNFSSIFKWIKDKFTVLLSAKPIKRIRELPKTAVLAVVLITLLIGANSVFWWYRATHGGFDFSQEPEEEITNEWEVDMNEQGLDEEELRKQYASITPIENQNETQEIVETSSEETEPEQKQDEAPTDEPINTQPEPETKPETKPKETAQVSALSTMAMPTVGKVITAFAMDTLVYSKTLEQWNTHNGIDIAADLGSPVKAAMEGIVAEVKNNDPRLGVVVILDHSGGIQTLYGNLQSDKLVKKGDKIEKGQVIGAVGQMAPFEIEDPPHLHFEVIKDGKNINPEQYLPKLN
ncbi:M23 family metallopeptidase [Tepidanaerobacter sp. GT38]|uniref:M23 family metallopeptidase n=1 Tax=Tepidanaerobacter sp. GT38 TaxID=2722793 RepID=UPI001F3E5E8A|nr:M23 family metallopeptidase [Tepidanaerobacter sp. GT38]